MSEELNELSSVIEFDTDIAVAEQPQPLPAGIYDATLVKAEVKESKKGNRYAALQFSVSPEQYPADYTDGNPTGTFLSYNRVMLDNTAQNKWTLNQFCRKIGASMSNRIDVSEWIGLTAKVEVTNSLWEGNLRAEISKLVD